MGRMTGMEKQKTKRFNFNCPEELFWAAREKTVKERTTLTKVLVNALEEYINDKH